MSRSSSKFLAPDECLWFSRRKSYPVIAEVGNISWVDGMWTFTKLVLLLPFIAVYKNWANSRMFLKLKQSVVWPLIFVPRNTQGRRECEIPVTNSTTESSRATELNSLKIISDFQSKNSVLCIWNHHSHLKWEFFLTMQKTKNFYSFQEKS